MKKGKGEMKRECQKRDNKSKSNTPWSPRI